MNPSDPVARETYTLLLSHFDLLWKVAGTALAGSGGVIVFLFLRLQSQGERMNTTLVGVSEALKDLKDAILERGRA